MREIKFRAWIKESEEMVHQKMASDFTMVSNGDGFGVVCGQQWIKKSEFEIMQFTGLKDKNGKEIYEGDILKSLAGIGMVVEFVDGEFKARNGLIGIARSAWYEREIIGNIHENPELLKP